MKKSKIYVFIFEDRQGNELTRKEADAHSLIEARAIAKAYKSNSVINDLYKIVVKSKY